MAFESLRACVKVAVQFVCSRWREPLVLRREPLVVSCRTVRRTVCINEYYLWNDIVDELQVRHILSELIRRNDLYVKNRNGRVVELDTEHGVPINDDGNQFPFEIILIVKPWVQEQLEQNVLVTNQVTTWNRALAVVTETALKNEPIATQPVCTGSDSAPRGSKDQQCIVDIKILSPVVVGNNPNTSFEILVITNESAIVQGTMSRDSTCQDVRRVLSETLLTTCDKVQLSYQGSELEDDALLTGLVSRRMRVKLRITAYVEGYTKVAPVSQPPPPVSPPPPPLLPKHEIREIRMCGRCGIPADNMACSTLVTHNSNNQNACRRCGWFKKTFQEWPLWDHGQRDRTWSLRYETTIATST